MKIQRSGSVPSGKGPEAWFTGAVRIDPLFQAEAPGRAGGASVTFQPGSRTAWHTHPLGQVLVVVAGCGHVQRRGGPVETVRPGDVVSFAAGEEHWHGATAAHGLTHIAIQEYQDGKAADWLEKVDDRIFRSDIRSAGLRMKAIAPETGASHGQATAFGSRAGGSLGRTA